MNQRFRGGSLEAEAESGSEPLVGLGKDLLKRWRLSDFPVAIAAVVVVVAGTLSTALDRIILCRLRDFTSHQALLNQSLHGRSQQSSTTSALPPALGHSACRQLRPLIVESGSPTEANVQMVLRLDDGALSRG